MADVERENDDVPPWRDNPERAWLKGLAVGGAIATVVALSVTILWLHLASPRLLTLREILPPDESLVLSMIPSLVLAALAATSAIGAGRSVRRLAVTATSLYLELPGRNGGVTVRVLWSEMTGLSSLGRMHPFGGLLITTGQGSHRLEALSEAAADQIHAVWDSYRRVADRD